jgi:hypothetical protein
MLRHGEMPNNASLQQTINTTQAALDQAKYEQALSSKGQILVEDAKQLLDSASRMITEKNSDEKFQRIFASSYSAGRTTTTTLSGSNVSTSSSSTGMSPNARGIWDNGKSVAMFLIRSGQFRDILLEVLELFQGILRHNQQPQTTVDSFGNVTSYQPLISEQTKHTLFSQFRSLLTQLGTRPEYYTAVDHLFMMIEAMNLKATMLKNSAQTTDGLPSSLEIDPMWSDVKLLIEEFAGAGTMNEFERRSYILFQAIQNDPEAQMFFKDFKVYTLETIQNPQLLNDESRVGFGRALIERGRILFQGKYKMKFHDVFDQARIILINIKNDALTQDFVNKLQKFGADFAFDSNGRPDLFVMQESLHQMKGILMPLISLHLSNLPIPKIEGSNPKYDFSIDGLILHVNDLLPEFVNIKTKTDTNLAVQSLSTQKNSTKIVMEVDKIRASFKDMKFSYRRKRMPKIEDHGVADVDLSQGTGVSVKIVWKLKSRMNEAFQLRLVKVKCNIDRLVIRVKSAKHNILDKLATKLFAGTIKKQIANAIVNNIISTLTPMSGRLNELFRRRPMIGVVERVNDGMKSTLFTGNTNDKSLLQRAKDTLSTGVSSIKGGNTHTTGYYGTSVQSYSPPNTWETDPFSTTGLSNALPTTTIVEEELIFFERPQTKEWHFEWYSPSDSDALTSASSYPENSNSNNQSFNQQSQINQQQQFIPV